VGIEARPGVRLRSAVCSCEIVVVRAPGDVVDLRCGGHPFVALETEVATLPNIQADFDGGSLRGKRYSNEAIGIEVLCTTAGEGSISVGTTVLTIPPHRPL
jgi:hypothetical protein